MGTSRLPPLTQAPKLAACPIPLHFTTALVRNDTEVTRIHNDQPQSEIESRPPSHVGMPRTP